jgi:hypothetical protein
MSATTPRWANRSPSRRNASSMPSRSSRGVGSLTRRLSRNPRRRHPTCGTRPGHVPALAHARLACRTGTRTALGPGWTTSPAQHGHRAWQMLRKAREQHIPALVAHRTRRVFKQPQSDPGWLLVIFLEELDDQPPLRVEVLLACHETSQISKGQRLVTHIHSVANAASTGSLSRVSAERPLPPSPGAVLVWSAGTGPAVMAGGWGPSIP